MILLFTIENLKKKKAVTRWEFTESDIVEKKEDGKWGKKL